jgi:hypothetical protein
MRLVIFRKERAMLEDVGIQFTVVGGIVGSSEPLKPTSSTSRPYFSFATFLATSATSCSAPLMTPTLMCLASLPL